MIKRNLIANYLGGAWSALMSVAFIPLYIQYLGIESFGLIGVFVALQGWFALLDMGLTPTINREMARFTAGQIEVQEIHNLLRSIEIVFLGVALLIASTIAIISPWLATNWLSAETLSVDIIGQALSIAGLIIGLRWFATLYRGAMLGLQRQVLLNSLNAVFATLRGGGAVLALVVFGAHVQVFFVFQGAVALLEALVLWIAVRSSLPRPAFSPSLDLTLLKSIGHFAAGMTGITILSTLMTQVDKVILSRWVGLAEFGHFTLATTVASVLIMLAIPISNVAFPRLTVLISQNDIRAVSELYHKFSQIISMTCVPVAVVICIYSEELLFFWTGDAAVTAAASPIVSVWIAGTAINALTHTAYSLQLAHGQLRVTIIAYSALIIAMVAALTLTVPDHGAIAASWVWVAANLCYVLVAIPVVHAKLLPTEFLRWIWGDTLIPAFAAVSVTLAMYPITQMVLTTGLISPILVLGLQGCVTLLASVLATPVGRSMVLKVIGNLARR